VKGKDLPDELDAAQRVEVARTLRGMRVQLLSVPVSDNHRVAVDRLG
jgi:hypothetical protein